MTLYKVSIGCVNYKINFEFFIVARDFAKATLMARDTFTKYGYGDSYIYCLEIIAEEGKDSPQNILLIEESIPA